jgi:hypothetical protein
MDSTYTYTLLQSKRMYRQAVRRECSGGYETEKVSEDKDERTSDLICLLSANYALLGCYTMQSCNEHL